MAPPDPPTLFAVAAEGYDRLMGRYLPTLGPAFADAAQVAAGQRVLDVGCGPGGLTTVLVRRVGADRVAALDPSTTFVATCAERNPGVDVRQGSAEELPYADDTFDASLASLVVGFMDDAAAGVGEMRRVTRPGGRVALSFWTLDAMPLLGTFWGAVAAVLGAGVAVGDDDRLGRRPGELARLLARVGATDVAQSRLACTAAYADFEDWWSSFTGGAGPVGAFLLSLTAEQRERVRDACDARLDRPRTAFTLTASAWCAVGTA